MEVRGSGNNRVDFGEITCTWVEGLVFISLAMRKSPAANNSTTE